VILDIFAGAGGWDTGLAQLGRRDVAGIDFDYPACSTATWAGHARFHDDVTEISPAAYEGIEGLIASPPCQALSSAGARKGVEDLDMLVSAIHATRTGSDLEQLLPQVRREARDERSPLSLQPLRYALATKPRWMAWEQVAPALPIWQACTHALRDAGYNVWTGVVSAEQYGVPQTRTRAILTAHRDQRAFEPPPTHSRFYWRHPDRRDRGVLPWVSMDQVLEPRDAIYVATSRVRASSRRMDQPAPAIAFGNSWGRWQSPDGEITKATLEEIGVLQTFPVDYPWHGYEQARYRQVADAVPPLMASRILASLLS
jgi:DNA (cytosine-5)-methyltransferase 1